MFGRISNYPQNYSNVTSKIPTNEKMIERITLLNDYLKTKNYENQIANTINTNEQFVSAKRIAKDNEFEIGSLVMKTNYNRNSKLKPLYVGPFKIIEKTNSNSFKLQDLKGLTLNRCVPISHLKPYKGNFNNEEHYYVEKIIDHKKENDGTILYRTRWYGYDETCDT